jgi:hypothetical protein
MKIRASVLAAAALIAAACSSDEGDGGGAAGAAGSSGGSSGLAGADGGGSAGASGADAGSAGEAGASGAAGAGGAHELLSQTGLFADIATETLASGVTPYEPAFALWSDGASKRRWLYLPPGSQIDSSDMDFWSYPVGTKVWKEFSRDGIRVETRLLEKIAAPDQWLMMAYHWNAAQTDAQAAPDGVANASGTEHDIPDQSACATCHDKMKDKLLSVSAIQLSHQNPGVSLSTLIADGKLSQPPAGDFTLPGDATARAALGALHANCGGCHNPGSFVFSQVDMDLWLSTAALGSVAETGTYKTTVNRPLTASNPTASSARIVPGNPGASDVHLRMSERGTLTQMPPLASELVDASGLASVDAWISSL